MSKYVGALAYQCDEILILLRNWDNIYRVCIGLAFKFFPALDIYKRLSRMTLRCDREPQRDQWNWTRDRVRAGHRTWQRRWWTVWQRHAWYWCSKDPVDDSLVKFVDQVSHWESIFGNFLPWNPAEIWVKIWYTWLRNQFLLLDEDVNHGHVLRRIFVDESGCAIVRFLAVLISAVTVRFVHVALPIDLQLLSYVIAY